MTKPITERQKRVVDAVKHWIREHGYPPTIRELGRHLGIKSLRGVTTHLDALAKKGYLQRSRGARGIRLLLEQAASSIERTIRVPILGRIAAGRPLFAEEQLEGQLVVDATFLGKEVTEGGPVHFALRVTGDSMLTAGILEGDYVIVRQQPTADNNDIVVALLGQEATVKRFFKEAEQIRLQPEHPTMAPILVGKDQPIELLGKVVAVFRQVKG